MSFTKIIVNMTSPRSASTEVTRGDEEAGAGGGDGRGISRWTVAAGEVSRATMEEMIAPGRV
jgi:hypothetical protein